MTGRALRQLSLRSRRVRSAGMRKPEIIHSICEVQARDFRSTVSLIKVSLRISGKKFRRMPNSRN